MSYSRHAYSPAAYSPDAYAMGVTRHVVGPCECCGESETYCETTCSGALPSAVTVTISGWTSDPTGLDANGTYVLDNISDCVWRGTFGGKIGGCVQFDCSETREPWTLQITATIFDTTPVRWQVALTPVSPSTAGYYTNFIDCNTVTHYPYEPTFDNYFTPGGGSDECSGTHTLNHPAPYVHNFADPDCDLDTETNPSTITLTI